MPRQLRRPPRSRSCSKQGPPGGKTITDELAFSLSGKNLHYGTPVNPAAPERIPGGSSRRLRRGCSRSPGGFCPGNRIPASDSGPRCHQVCSHTPNPRQNIDPWHRTLAPSFDTVSWLARDARVLSRVGRILLGDPLPPPPLRRLLIAEDAFALGRPSPPESVAGHPTKVRSPFQTVGSHPSDSRAHGFLG